MSALNKNDFCKYAKYRNLGGSGQFLMTATKGTCLCHFASNEPLCITFHLWLSLAVQRGNKLTKLRSSSPS